MRLVLGLGSVVVVSGGWESRTRRELYGAAGTATEVVVTRAPEIGQQAIVICWLLHCPGQAIFWDRFLLSIVHLRPILGDPRRAEIRIPGASHEVMLLALDPDEHPSPADPSTWVPLMPPNAVEQFEVPSDDAAVELAALAARAIVDGLLPAEPMLSGQVEPWRTVIIRTSAHLRGEEHAS